MAAPEAVEVCEPEGDLTATLKHYSQSVLAGMGMTRTMIMTDDDNDNDVEEEEVITPQDDDKSSICCR
jgi:hypothetical protein